MSPLEIIIGGYAVANLGALARISYQLGWIKSTVVDHDRRLTKLEARNVSG